MKEKRIWVFEELGEIDRSRIQHTANKNVHSYVLEPMYAYHYNSGSRFSCEKLPLFAKDLINSGMVTLLNSTDLNEPDLYLSPASWAVEQFNNVEQVYKNKNKNIFKFLTQFTGRETESEAALLKSFCDRIAQFRSVYILIQALSKKFTNCNVFLSTLYSVDEYNYICDLFFDAGVDCRIPDNIQIKTRRNDIFRNVKSRILFSVKLFAGMIPNWSVKCDKQIKPASKILISIISPGRQLAKNQRGPDFIIDGKIITKEDVSYFPVIQLNNEQRKALASLCGFVCEPGISGICLDNVIPSMLCFLKSLFVLKNRHECMVAGTYFYLFYKWKNILKKIEISNFLTHADFDQGHYGRNAAMHAAGVKTWYYTDSMNIGSNYQNLDEATKMYHPFWAFLCYDYFVTWAPFLQSYYSSHPGAIRNVAIIGCIWSSHISRNRRDEFNVAVFDTTYTSSGLTTYKEGIAFAKDLYRLIMEFKEIRLIFKEKKSRTIHDTLDSINGPVLRDAYDQLAKTGRVKFLDDRENTSEAMSQANIVISFPFTSTTFEALAAGMPAVWHDPLNRYSNTQFGRIKKITTGSYDELSSFIKDVINEKYSRPLPLDSPLMDPYCDGKAIDRFRAMLCQGYING